MISASTTTNLARTPGNGAGSWHGGGGGVFIALVADVPEMAWSEIEGVAAALQDQAHRNAAPVWGVTVTVRPFACLAEVPIDHGLVVLTHRRLGDDADAHVDGHGAPLAMVALSAEWSLAVSRELLPLLLTPCGALTSRGAEVEVFDASDDAIIVGDDAPDEGDSPSQDTDGERNAAATSAVSSAVSPSVAPVSRATAIERLPREGRWSGWRLVAAGALAIGTGASGAAVLDPHPASPRAIASRPRLETTDPSVVRTLSRSATVRVGSFAPTRVPSTHARPTPATARSDTAMPSAPSALPSSTSALPSSTLGVRSLPSAASSSLALPSSELPPANAQDPVEHLIGERK